MEYKKCSIRWQDATVVAGVLFVMMIVGSIWDFPISSALYNQSNPFGILFASYGEAPAMLGLFTSGLLLILGCNKKRRGIALLQIVAGVLLCGFGGIMIAYLPNNYLTTSPVLVAVIGICLLVLTAVAVLWLCKGAQREAMVRVALILFTVIFLEMILINVIKIPWERPRMRLIAENSQAYFVPWWSVGGNLREQLMALGVAGEEFKSFPSGHTANGAVLMLLCVLPYLKPSLQNRSRVLFYIGAVWGLLVALSRVIMGAHFITDTTMGFIVTFILILITLKISDVSLDRRSTVHINNKQCEPSGVF